eukprot:13596321-Alexandrium_andersonii.AAC.1
MALRVGNNTRPDFRRVHGAALPRKVREALGQRERETITATSIRNRPGGGPSRQHGSGATFAS